MDYLVPDSDRKYINAFEKYYKLKSENDEKIKLMNKKKRKIMNSKDLTLEQKEYKIKNIKKRCIQCGNLGGTDFGCEDGILYAKCNSNSPCDLNIQIKKSQTLFLPSYIKLYDEYLNDLKKDIVITKLNYLFDLEKEDITSQKFKVTKDEFVKYDKIYNLSKRKLNHKLTSVELVDPDGNTNLYYRKDILIEKKKLLNEHLKNIASIQKKYKSNPKKFSLTDSVRIYTENVIPLLHDIRKINYDNMFMDSFHISEEDNTFKEKIILKQIKNNISSYCFVNDEGEVLENKVQQKQKKVKKVKKVKKKQEEKKQGDQDEVTDYGFPEKEEEDVVEDPNEEPKEDVVEDPNEEPKEDVVEDPDEDVVEDPDEDVNTTLDSLEELEEFEPSLDN